MKLKRITGSEDIMIGQLEDLYTGSFPETERRDIEQLKYLVENEDRMFFNAIINDNILAGFFIYWKFDNFYFLEHFAIYPDMRNQKIGQKILDYIRGNLEGVQILEVEPPADEFSIRRIAYYERNNYKIIKKDYKQPSYRKHGVYYDLWLMSNESNLNEIDKYIGIIEQNVYKK